MSNDTVITTTAQGSDVEEESEKNVCTKQKIAKIYTKENSSEIQNTCQLLFGVSTTENFGEDYEEGISVFILSSFDEIPNGTNCRVLGKTALMELEQKKDTVDPTSFLTSLRKPLYCHSLSGQVICFTGFKNKHELLALRSLVHHMGGSVRKEMHMKVTHLIAKICSGEKYLYAVTFGVPVVSENWIYAAWENRDIIGFSAADKDFMLKFKLKPFHGSKVCFLGYPEDEKDHMIDVLKENGGEPTDLTDPTCTHLVTDQSINPFRMLSTLSYLNKSPTRSSDTYCNIPCASEESSIPIKKIKVTENKENTPGTPRENVDQAAKPSSSVLTESNANRLFLQNRSRIAKNRNLNNVKRILSICEVNEEQNDGEVPELCTPSPTTGPRRKGRAGESQSPLIGGNYTPQQQSAASNSTPVSAYVENLPPSYLRYRTRSTLDNASPATCPSPSLTSELNLSYDYAEGNRDVTMEVSMLREESFANRCAINDDMMTINGDVSTSTVTDPFTCNWLNFPCPSRDPRHTVEYLDESANPETVVDEMKISAAPPLKSNKTFIVKTEWFWTSVQHEERKNEMEFKFENVNINLTPGLNGTPLSTASSSRARKRKRHLRDRFSSFNSDLSPGQSAQKRRSSVSDGTRLSDGSFLDYTASPDVIDEVESSAQEKVKSSPRFEALKELLNTEDNYVKILGTMMTLFKAPLEEMVGKDAELLNGTEIKIIFGHLPPIYAIHYSMLKELEQLFSSQCNEEIDIGNLILKYSADLVKAYPPYVNFLDNSCEMLTKCDRTKLRFHAFLKVCQSKEECKRKSLKDLLIEPVQRLPRIKLLLEVILRYSQKNSIDCKAIEAAISSLEEVLSHLNEDKRRTQGQVALFEIFSEIENCPVYLISSQRCFIGRCEVTELSENLSGRGNSLVLFLFSDAIEVCKKKKSFHNLKSPKEGRVMLYKHVKLLPLNTVMKVIDIKATEDCSNVFAIMINNGQQQQTEEKVYSFTITDKEVEKSNYLRTLCTQIASINRSDMESYLTCLDAEQLDIDTSETSTGTLGKAFNKFATKTKIKVGRALSFNKTPNKLKRAVSTIMSPFGNQSALTPSTQLANLQLAVLPNLPVFSHLRKTPAIKDKHGL